MAISNSKKTEEVEKRQKCVPLQEALNATGFGKYTIFLFLTGGFVHFSADCGVQIMSFIIPAATCDLKFTSYEKGLLSPMGITGMLTSAHLCGVLADVYGRRRVLVCSLFLQAAICVVSSFATSPLILTICWFFYGNAAAGVLTPVLVYINEFCPENMKTKAMIIIVGFGALAEAYLAFIAWLIIPLEISVDLGILVFNSWRLYLAVLSVPIIISLFLLLRFPESPKFLLNQGKYKETLHILQTIYSTNNNDKKENYPVASIELDIEDKQLQGDLESGRSFMKFLKSMLSNTIVLFNRTFIFYTLLSSAVLLGMGSAYLTALFWIPDQVSHLLHYSAAHNDTPGLCEIVPAYMKASHTADLSDSCSVNQELFLVTMVLGVVQVITLTATILVSDLLPKKLLLGIILIVPGCLSILTMYLREPYYIIASQILTPSISEGAFAVAFTMVLIYFPTSIRSNAASITMNIGRVGISLLTLLFGMELEYNCYSAYWTLAGVYFVTVILSFMLPSRRKTECEDDVVSKAPSKKEENV